MNQRSGSVSVESTTSFGWMLNNTVVIVVVSCSVRNLRKYWTLLLSWVCPHFTQSDKAITPTIAMIHKGETIIRMYHQLYSHKKSYKMKILLQFIQNHHQFLNHCYIQRVCQQHCPSFHQFHEMCYVCLGKYTSHASCPIKNVKGKYLCSNLYHSQFSYLSCSTCWLQSVYEGRLVICGTRKSHNREKKAKE